MIDYSANLEDALDIAGLCEAVRAAAADIDAFPTPGIRVRAACARHFAIADGNPDHAFIDISVRLRAGRAPEVKQDAAQRIFAAAKAFTAEYMARRPLALSLEMRDIDAALSPKTGTIRDHMEPST